MNALKSVVFDLDGTLIDSVPDVRAALNQVLAEDGYPNLSLDQVKGMIGEGARKTIENALVASGAEISTAALDDFTKRYLAAYLADPAGHTVVYPGAFEVLKLLQDAGVTLGICTNKPGATTRPVLKALAMDGFFSAVVTADDTAFRKPDGRHVLETLQAMGSAPDKAVFIGDSETDMEAANDAGIPAVLVTYGYCHRPLETLNMAVAIDDLRALPDVLRTVSMGFSG